jgi:glucose/arabinose dehydrogenase
MSGDGSGDNAPIDSAQDGQSLAGKILRIDVSSNSTASEIPPSYPFIANNGVRDEVYALGLMNPWRCSFDRVLVSKAHLMPLYCGDAGGHIMQEIDRLLPGDNGGWNTYDGANVLKRNTTALLGNLTFPAYEYKRPNVGGATVIGGYFIR